MELSNTMLPFKHLLQHTLRKPVDSHFSFIAFDVVHCSLQTNITNDNLRTTMNYRVWDLRYLVFGCHLYTIHQLCSMQCFLEANYTIPWSLLDILQGKNWCHLFPVASSAQFDNTLPVGRLWSAASRTELGVLIWSSQLSFILFTAKHDIILSPLI